MSKKQGLFSSQKFRHGSLATLFTAIFAVGLILLNVVATALSDRFPLTIDLTANRDFTITLAEQHETFVKSIENDVNIIVCAGKDDMENGNYVGYMQSFYMMEDTTDGQRYYNQAKIFLEDFHKLNPHISVTWSSPLSTNEFAALSQKYSGETISYGDVIVESSFQNEAGQTINRYRILKASELFQVEDQSGGYAQYGMATYTVVGSKLETSLVSAFYVVTAEESISVAVIGGHSGGDNTGLETLLKQNNYEFTTVSNLMTEEIPEDTRMVIIHAPTQDYNSVEIGKLEAFLYNGGNLGKELLYVASVSQPSLPNLEDFLQEWGFDITAESVYATTAGTYYQSPTYIFAQPGDTEHTEFMEEDTDRLVYPSAYRAMKLLFEDNGTRYTDTVLTSDQEAVGMPIEADAETWDAQTATSKGPFPLMAVSTQFDLLGSTQQQVESHVVVLTSDLFLYSEILSTNGFANSTVILNTLNGVAGVEAPIEIQSRQIATTTFYDKVMGSVAPLVVQVFFIGILPIGLLVIGLFVFVRRKNL